MTFDVNDIIRQSRDAVPFTRERLAAMLALPPDSPEAYALMAEARRLSRELTGDRFEVHGQFALNLAPCPKNCAYCSFAAVNGVFTESVKLSVEEAVDAALALEADGVNAVYMMATASYDFGELLELTAEVRARLRPQTVLVGNVGDQNPRTAAKLKDAGLDGAYHAWRLREGEDTGISPEARRRSMEAFREAGIVVGTCVEPVGPEHTDEELAEKILYTASLDPAYSGAARRIAIPGTEMARRGMISELRMAQVVAVTRLGMPRTVTGNCTHEPYTLGAAAGASLFWAERGANPRDVKERTEEGRGFSPERCRALFADAEAGVLEGPSAFYRKRPHVTEAS